jgi:hypothetical protein
VVELNTGPAHPQSQASGRFPSTVVVSNFPHAPGSNSDSEPATTLTNKNDIMEMGKLHAEKPDVRYEF